MDDSSSCMQLLSTKVNTICRRGHKHGSVTEEGSEITLINDIRAVAEQYQQGDTSSLLEVIRSTREWSKHGHPEQGRRFVQ